jgi:predicted phosphodiesterase
MPPGCAQPQLVAQHSVTGSALVVVTVPAEGLGWSRARASPLRHGAAGRTPGGVLVHIHAFCSFYSSDVSAEAPRIQLGVIRWLGYKLHVVLATHHGPAEWEGPEVSHFGPVRQVAVVSDVHANVTALTAVLAEIETVGVDLIVSCGDLTWGSQPDETISLMRSLGDRALFVRGNGERAALELSGTSRTALARTAQSPRESWVPSLHSADSLAFVAAIPFSIVVDITGLGPVRFCHGSPRSDTEIVTPATPDGRFAELCAGIDEQVLVTGHTHLQFDRRVAGRRSVNPGSVGLPYHEGEPGTAYWALLGPDVELRQTRYDVSAATAVGVRLGDPGAEVISDLLMSPPSPAQITAESERLVFSN